MSGTSDLGLLPLLVNMSASRAFARCARWGHARHLHHSQASL